MHVAKIQQTKTEQLLALLISASIIFKDSVRTAQETNTVSIIKTNQLLQYRQTDLPEIYIEHTHTQNTKTLQAERRIFNHETYWYMK